jgi:hypothetical protein
VTFEPELEYDYEEQDTAEMEAVAVAAEPPPDEPVQHELEGVTQSADWDLRGEPVGFTPRSDDPEDFSAPV